MSIQASEISSILKDQIKNFGQEAEVAEVGRVLSVGDGIARVYGLDNVQAGEMVEFPGGIQGMALNLESDNVGVVIFGTDRDIKEGEWVKLAGWRKPTPVGELISLAQDNFVPDPSYKKPTEGSTVREYSPHRDDEIPFS